MVRVVGTGLNDSDMNSKCDGRTSLETHSEYNFLPTTPDSGMLWWSSATCPQRARSVGVRIPAPALGSDATGRRSKSAKSTSHKAGPWDLSNNDIYFGKVTGQRPNHCSTKQVALKWVPYAAFSFLSTMIKSSRHGSTSNIFPSSYNRIFQIIPFTWPAWQVQEISSLGKRPVKQPAQFIQDWTWRSYWKIMIIELRPFAWHLAFPIEMRFPMQPRESLVVFVHGLHHGIQPLCRGRDLITGNFRHWVLSGSQNQLCSLPNK